MTDRASTLQPTRPLVWIGVETTGTGPAKSRIAKIAILRIEPTGVTTNYIRRWIRFPSGTAWRAELTLP